MVWVCRDTGAPSQTEMVFHAQASCLSTESATIMTLIVSISSAGNISNVGCARISSPTVLQINYPDLVREAERQRNKINPAHNAGNDRPE